MSCLHPVLPPPQTFSWITHWQKTSARTISWWDSCSGRSAWLCRSSGRFVRYPSTCWRVWWSNIPLMTATPPKSVLFYQENQRVRVCVWEREREKWSFYDIGLLFQSQQARLATLYLPLFGLLQENVNRLNVKEVSLFTINHSIQVRTPPSGVVNVKCKFII